MDSGSYRLYLRLNQSLTLNIGALGLHKFKPGIYVYTGSAMRNLSKRIERHRRPDKTKRWHIDYLTSHPAFQIIKVQVYPSPEREECVRNMQVEAQAFSEIPMKRFGSSDCRTCPAHLFYFPNPPEIMEEG